MALYVLSNCQNKKKEKINRRERENMLQNVCRKKNIDDSKERTKN